MQMGEKSLPLRWKQIHRALEDIKQVAFIYNTSITEESHVRLKTKKDRARERLG